MTKNPGSIVDAVSRAIRNGEKQSVYQNSEGAAYKAAFERQGAHIDRLFESVIRDAAVMCVLVERGPIRGPHGVLA